MINDVLLRWGSVVPHAIKRQFFRFIRITALWILLGTLHVSGKTWPQMMVDMQYRLAAKSQKTISGTVVDDKGQPLAGVTVSVKGTAVMTTTDENGRYRIEVPPGGTLLLFTNVGFESIERSI